MNHNALSNLLRRGILCLGLVLAFGSLKAQVGTSVSASYGPVSASCSITYNPTAGTVTFTGAKSADSGGNAASVYYQTAGGVGIYTGTAGNLSVGSGAGSGSATFSATPGSWWRMWLFFSGPAESSGSHDYPMYFQAGTTANYKVTFAIPANTTDKVIRYEVWQDGAWTGQSVTTSPGDASREETFNGLNSANPATLREVRVNFTQGSDGMWYNTGSDLVREVNGGTTPVVSTGTTTPGAVAGPTDAVSGQPAGPHANMTAKAPDVTAPTTTTPLTVPGAITAPNATPTGATGATKQDIEKLANDITAAVSEVRTQNTTNANAIVDSVNKASVGNKDQANAIIKAQNTTSTAVDNVASRVTDGLSAVYTRIDTTNTKLEDVKTKLDTGNTNTGAIKTSVDALKTAIEARQISTADAQTAATASNASAATASSTAVTGISAIVNGSGTAPTTLSYTPDVSGSGSFMQITIPPEFSKPGGITVDFNPFAEGRMGGLATFLRSATQWAILGLLSYFIFSEIKKTFGQAASAQQAKGNTIAAGTGGQATSLIAAGLITTAMVALATGLMAWGFNGITTTSLITNMTTNPLASAPANILWVIDQVFPVTTAIAAFIARVSFPLYSTALFATYSTVVRFIVP